MKNLKKSLILILFSLISFNAIADVLKPALVETTIYQERVELQITLNLEAVLSEITTNVKNTNGASNEDYYKELRVLEPQELQNKFKQYQAKFLQNIDFKIDNHEQKLNIKSVKIDPVGYLKRGRNSVIILTTNSTPKQSIAWKYSKTYGDSAFRFRFFAGDENYSWQTWQIVRDEITINTAKFQPLTTFENLTKFITTGFYHVIPLGFDHILFIIAMALSALSFWRVAVLVSSFTLAHTITLGLASADIIMVNPNIVEPLIALSIALVAIENLFFKYHHKRQIIIVFMFGLLHGVGFASMLKTFITDSFASSLIGFNLGVEFAQILIVSSVLLILFLFNKTKIQQKFITIPINLTIAIIATTMILERI